MTPAETLRKAATLMRERAERAHPSPWDFETEVGGFGPVGCVMVPFSPHHPGARSGLTSFTPLGTQNAKTAEHIASWHPEVAKAVAAWLEQEAAEYDELASTPYGSAGAAFVAGDFGGDVDPALAVARTYLGEAS